MGLTMKRILEKYKEADMFSLTGEISVYKCPLTGEEYNKAIEGMNYIEREEFRNKFIKKYTITEAQYDEALKSIEDHLKDKYKKIYESRREEYKNYPDFDILFNEIEEECRKFDCDENRMYYIKKHFNEEMIAKYKENGISDNDIENMKNNFFKVSFIADRVREITKYEYGTNRTLSGVEFELINNITEETCFIQNKIKVQGNIGLKSFYSYKDDISENIIKSCMILDDFCPWFSKTYGEWMKKLKY